VTSESLLTTPAPIRCSDDTPLAVLERASASLSIHRDFPFLGRLATNMKTSIPSDVWETKRSEIAVLYKDEEWPLKQVIKRIRTEDFNPT
jgi:hypothetical protein